MLSPAQTNTIKIDLDDIVAEVDPNIYGVFMEPIGLKLEGHDYNTLYGPLYDPDSPEVGEDGFRLDMIEAARELELTQMRWPGGNFVAAYDWRDGIGPKDQRPKRMELAWGVVESNQVGTDEWVKLNELIGSTNVACINMGTGDLDDARFWVEYCNAPLGTYWADKRGEYGNDEPFGIEYWCLGNEVDGEPWIIGYKNSEDYIKFAREAAKAMQRSSPGTPLKFIANGSSNYSDSLDWVDWNWSVIKGLYGTADYLSLHRYWESSDDYYVFMGQRAMDLDEKISITKGQLETVHAVRKDKPMYISFDEWAPPHRGGHLPTMALAQFFNAFIRHADGVKMANYTLLTSLLSRKIETGETYKSPLFYAFKLFSTRAHGTSLNPVVDCETFSTSEFYDKIPYLDVSSTLDHESGKLVINVVNRHKDESIDTEISFAGGTFSGEAEVASIASDDRENRAYQFSDRASYEPTVELLPVDSESFNYSFAPCSFTQIVVSVTFP